MAQASALHTSAGHADDQEIKTHPKPRFYISIFFVLLVVTIAEVIVAQDPLKSMVTDMGVPLLIPLFALALFKGLTIVMFYMHLKMDSRVFSAFFMVGLILAVSMIVTFMGLFTAHYRLPFDQEAWRQSLEEGATSSSASAATGTTAGGGH